MGIFLKNILHQFAFEKKLMNIHRLTHHIFISFQSDFKNVSLFRLSQKEEHGLEELHTQKNVIDINPQYLII